MDWMKEISRRLELILSDGVSIDNEWFTLVKKQAFYYLYE